MKRGLSFILFFSYVIVLLHNFTPHSHDFLSENQDEVANNEHDILNLLQNIFASNLGDSHLENYENADANENIQLKSTGFFALNQAFLLSFIFNYEISEITIPNSPESQHLPKKFDIHHQSFSSNAPPFLS